MRGIGRWLNRDLTYTVTDSEQNDAVVGEYVVVGPPLLGVEWGASCYAGGMGIPAAWRAAILISNLIGGMPFQAYRGLGAASRRVEPTPPLLAQPSPPETAIETLSSMVLDYVWHGTAVALKGGFDSTFGEYTSIRPVSVERVGAGYDQAGRAVYRIDGKTVPRDQLMIIKGPCAPGSLKGESVIGNHLRSIELSREQMYQAGNLGAAGVPSGVLQTEDPEVTPEELATAKREWLASQRRRTIAALPPGVKFEPLAWNPTEMQMLEARKFDLGTWELIFGLPVGYLGAEGPSMTYGNITQDDLRLLKMTLGPIVQRFEQAFTLLFGSPVVWVKANVDAVLRADTLTRYQAHALALGGIPWKTADEVRALEDMGPMPVPDPVEAPPAADPAAPDAVPPARAATEAPRMIMLEPTANGRAHRG